MIWALPADQRTVLDLFGTQSGAVGDARELTTSNPPWQSGAEVLLLWADDPRRRRGSDRDAETGLPDAVAVPKGGMREFLAWATTVIGGFRPFTAFFKVVAQDQLDLALGMREPSLEDVQNALVGLIIGESLAHSAGTQRSVSGLPLLSCESTYSFSCARAWALGFRNGDGYDAVAGPWTLARRLTRQPPRRVSDDLIQAALGVLRSLAEREQAPGAARLPPFVREACREIHERGEVVRSWSHLDGWLRGLGDEVKGPREQRVRAFERALQESSSLDPTTAAFLIGLLADQIGPGTFEHVELLAPYLQERPMAAVWYGLCAGLGPRSEVLQVGNCLGRRIARDLLAPDPIVARPKYDISVQELEVCLDRDVPVEFRTASQNHMAVELLPGVPAFVKWPVKEAPPFEGGVHSGAAPTPSGHQRDLFGRTDAELAVEGRALLSDIEKATGRVRAIFSELSRRGTDEERNRGGERRRRGNRR